MFGTSTRPISCTRQKLGTGSVCPLATHRHFSLISGRWVGVGLGWGGGCYCYYRHNLLLLLLVHPSSTILLLPPLPSTTATTVPPLYCYSYYRLAFLGVQKVEETGMANSGDELTGLPMTPRSPTPFLTANMPRHASTTTTSFRGSAGRGPDGTNGLASRARGRRRRRGEGCGLSSPHKPIKSSRSWPV